MVQGPLASRRALPIAGPLLSFLDTVWYCTHIHPHRHPARTMLRATHVTLPAPIIWLLFSGLCHLGSIPLFHFIICKESYCWRGGRSGCLFTQVGPNPQLIDPCAAAATAVGMLLQSLWVGALCSPPRSPRC